MRENCLCCENAVFPLSILIVQIVISAVVVMTYLHPEKILFMSFVFGLIWGEYKVALPFLVMPFITTRCCIRLMSFSRSLHMCEPCSVCAVQSFRWNYGIFFLVYGFWLCCFQFCQASTLAQTYSRPQILDELGLRWVNIIGPRRTESADFQGPYLDSWKDHDACWWRHSGRSLNKLKTVTDATVMTESSGRHGYS